MERKMTDPRKLTETATSKLEDTGFPAIDRIIAELREGEKILQEHDTNLSGLAIHSQFLARVVTAARTSPPGSPEGPA